MTRCELIQWIHDEIASQGTSSRFWGHGLDPETGEYDAEKIADSIAAAALGSIKSKRKAKSSRANGKLGGRPRKQTH